MFYYYIITFENSNGFGQKVFGQAGNKENVSFNIMEGLRHLKSNYGFLTTIPTLL